MFCDLCFDEIVVLICILDLSFCLTVGGFRVVAGDGESVVFRSIVELSCELVIFCFFFGIHGLISDKFVIFNCEVVGASKDVWG